MRETTTTSKTYIADVFLILFLFLLPLSIRKVFFFFPVSPEGIFNEYTDISLYASDLALWAFFLIIILCNINIILSIKYWKEMFHVKQRALILLAPVPFILWSFGSIFWSENQMLATYSSFRLLQGYFLYSGLILFFVSRETIFIESSCSIRSKRSLLFHVKQYFCSLSKTPNVSRETTQNGSRNSLFGIAYFSAIAIKKLKTFLFHVKHLIESIQCFTWNKWRLVFFVCIVFGFTQSFFAVLQFFKQESLGLIFFKESVFTIGDRGIASVIFDGESIFRAYGLFPHPNVLGGFLATTLLISIAYPLLFHRFHWKMFHVKQTAVNDNVVINVSRETIASRKHIADQVSEDERMFHVKHSFYRWFYRLAVFFQLSALFLTFSKAAISGFFLGLAYLLYTGRKMFHVKQTAVNDNVVINVSRETNSDEKRVTEKTSDQTMFHVKHLWFTVGSVVLLTFLFFKAINIHYFIIQPLSERFFLFQAVFQIGKNDFFGGLGIGQLVPSLQRFFIEDLSLWQFQPVHNIYFLVFSELGMIGLFFFFLFICVVMKKNVSRETFDGVENQEKMFHVKHLHNKFLFHIFYSIILTYAFIGLFDHYLWDIQQGQLLFWSVTGFLAASKMNLYDIDK